MDRSVTVSIQQGNSSALEIFSSVSSVGDLPSGFSTEETDVWPTPAFLAKEGLIPASSLTEQLDVLCHEGAGLGIHDPSIAPRASEVALIFALPV